MDGHRCRHEVGMTLSDLTVHQLEHRICSAHADTTQLPVEFLLSCLLMLVSSRGSLNWSSRPGVSHMAQFCEPTPPLYCGRGVSRKPAASKSTSAETRQRPKPPHTFREVTRGEELSGLRSRPVECWREKRHRQRGRWETGCRNRSTRLCQAHACLPPTRAAMRCRTGGRDGGCSPCFLETRHEQGSRYARHPEWTRHGSGRPSPPSGNKPCTRRWRATRTSCLDAGGVSRGVSWRVSRFHV